MGQAELDDQRRGQHSPVSVGLQGAHNQTRIRLHRPTGRLSEHRRVHHLPRSVQKSREHVRPRLAVRVHPDQPDRCHTHRRLDRRRLQRGHFQSSHSRHLEQTCAFRLVLWASMGAGVRQEMAGEAVR